MRKPANCNRPLRTDQADETANSAVCQPQAQDAHAPETDALAPAEKHDWLLMVIDDLSAYCEKFDLRAAYASLQFARADTLHDIGGRASSAKR